MIIDGSVPEEAIRDMVEDYRPGRQQAAAGSSSRSRLAWRCLSEQPWETRFKPGTVGTFSMDSPSRESGSCSNQRR